MVERSLSMREAPGSIPGFSMPFVSFLCLWRRCKVLIFTLSMIVAKGNQQIEGVTDFSLKLSVSASNFAAKLQAKILKAT